MFRGGCFLESLFKHWNKRKAHSVEDYKLDWEEEDELKDGGQGVGGAEDVEEFAQGEEKHREQDLWHHI